MNRRNFTQSTLIAGMGIASVPNIFSQSVVITPHQFNLMYAPHLGMFKHSAGDDPIDQLNFMADQGFTAFEDNGMNTRTIAVQEKMAATMKKRNLTMGVFVAYKDFRNPTLVSGKADDRKEFLRQIEASITVAKRVNAKWVTVVPGTVDLKLVEDYQTANVIESLKQASAILEPHGIIMVLEPLNWYKNHAGLYLKESPQAFQICKAVNSPSCKILFDIYHQQIQEGNLIPNIDKCWDEIAYFQNEFPIEFEVLSNFNSDTENKILITHKGKTVYEELVKLDAKTPLSKQIFIEATEEGIQYFDVSISSFEGEKNTQNNTQRIAIEVLNNLQNILILSSAPHPDIAALKSAL